MNKALPYSCSSAQHRAAKSYVDLEGDPKTSHWQRVMNTRGRSAAQKANPHLRCIQTHFDFFKKCKYSCLNLSIP